MSDAYLSQGYDLSALSAEMTEDIVLLSDDNPNAVFSELRGLREKARQDKAPETAYVTFLHRKYTGIVSSQRDLKEAGHRGTPFLTYLCTTDPYSCIESEKTGWAATRTKLFRLRCIMAILALITFAMMSSAPYIGNRDFKPNHHFHRGCTFKGKFIGSFNFRGYQTVIAVGVMCFVHNMAQMVLYVLLVDGSGNKYIPGAARLMARILQSQRRADAASTWCAECHAAHGKFIEVLVDGLLLVMAVVSFAVSQYLFETAVPATVMLRQENSYQSIAVEEYYTLGTCYLTYSHKTPACLDAGLNPTSKIRAALVFLFFATLFQPLCFINSLRKFQAHDYHNIVEDVQPDSPSFGEAHTTTVVPSVGGAFLSDSVSGTTRSYSGQISKAEGVDRSIQQLAPAATSVYSIVEGEELFLEEHSV